MDIEIISRFKSMLDADGLYIDAFAKSLRKYETDVHPLWIECIVLLTDEELEPIRPFATTRSGSYKFYRRSRGLELRQAMNFVMQSFFDMEEPRFHRIIYPRCSKKTSCGIEAYGNCVMAEYIEQRIRLEDLAGRAQAFDFKVLCAQELGYLRSSELLDNPVHQTSMFRSIIDFLQRNNLTFPVDDFLTIPNRVEDQRDLIMDSRFYPARSDLRAFCKDRNLLRHLTGCCLHQLILPKNKEMRQGLQRESIIPTFDKDLLNMSLPRREGYTTLLGLGDISNFTGSAANAWVMLLCMALHLDSDLPGWRKSPNMFCVGGSFLYATWRDLIVIYLYTTVGMPCFVEADPTPQYLGGGFLGVAGNITVGLLYLSMILEDVVRYWRGKTLGIRAQAGGDDCGVGVTARKERAWEVMDYCKFVLRKYVGYLKAWDVVDLETIEDGEIIPGVLFCRKPVRLIKTRDWYVLKGIRSIPIPESLTPAGYIRSPPEQLEAWNDLHRDLLRFDLKEPGFELMSDTIRELFLHRYPRCNPPCFTTRIKILKPEARLNHESGYLMTDTAWIVITSYSDLHFQGREYLTTVPERIQHALVRGDLMLHDAIVGRNSRTILTTKKQNITYSELNVTYVGIRPDSRLLNTLLELY